MSSGDGRAAREHGGRRWWYVLLALPFLGLLYPPLYAKKGPELFGFPFFYWYQFAWVVVASALTILVYVNTRADHARADR
jgi:uncharacterized protein DUF3311